MALVTMALVAMQVSETLEGLHSMAHQTQEHMLSQVLTGAGAV